MRISIFLYVMFATLFLYVSPATAAWNLAVSCDEGALRIYRDDDAPNRFRFEVTNLTVRQYLETHHFPSVGVSNPSGNFLYGSAIIRTFDNSEPLRTVDFIAMGRRLKVVTETRSHKTESWQWTDSTGYPRSGSCTVRFGRPCAGAGRQSSNRQVEAYSRNWVFSTCEYH